MTVFLQPRSVDEASAMLLADEWGSKLIAGGTALVLMMRQGLLAPDTLVSLQDVGGLRGISAENGGLRIGARTTLTEVAEHEDVRRLAPSLAYACHRVGNVRIRNVATLGGNVAEADYASDPPSVLVSLDAVCVVQGSGGERTVPVREVIAGFYTTTLEPGEIITAVLVPAAPPGRRTSYRKFVSRSSEDRPCVGVAVRADFDGDALSDLSVVVGAVADVPQRFDELVQSAIGGSLGAADREAIARAYAEALDPMEDARGSAWYRRQVAEVFVRRALEDVVNR